MQPNSPKVTIIEAHRGSKDYWIDLFRFRELLYILVWRDLIVRYKQTVIGVAWGLIRPLLVMVILTFVFGRLAGLPSGNIPYPLLVFAATLPWQFFSSALVESGNSLVGQANMITKIYFPRMLVPFSSIMINAVDFVISLAIMAGLMIYYRYLPSLYILALPLYFVLLILLVFGMGLWVSALNVKYRDIKFIVPFIVQFGLYATPVGFLSSAIPDNLRLLFSLNPMVGIIDGFRYTILGGGNFYWPSLLITLFWTLTFLITGIKFFHRTEKGFADII